MNDTTREVGGALGIAVFGTIANTAYRSMVDFAGLGLPAGADAAARESVGAATGVAAQLGGSTGAELVDRAAGAFTDAVNVAAAISVVVLIAAAFVVLRVFSRSKEQEAITADADATADANATVDLDAEAAAIELVPSPAGAD
jgi:DHA2 family multidrug resistance protein-like MFS transporter